MTSPPTNTNLLAPAIGYALDSLTCVTPRLLTRPTPCAAWDLASLLRHLNDSLAALCEGLATGYVRSGPTADDAAGGLVTAFRDRADQLLAASVTAANQDRAITIADRRLAASVVTAVGAVEIAVHGWDIAQTCRYPRPIPPALATDILNIIPLLVTDSTRNGHFAASVTVSPLSHPSDRLVALLGRSPVSKP